MKNFKRVVSVVLLLLTTALGKDKSVRVTVENPADVDRKCETISLPLKDLARRIAAIDVEHIVVLDAKTGVSLLSQVAESDLIFQSDFKPRERKEFVVRQPEVKVAKQESLVDGRFEVPREDYAWENDKIAFRMYGPALAAEVNNGIDVWTKRVKYLIVDKWYSASAAAGKDTYHEDRGEGADFFSVGRSLGAGGSGLWLNGKVCQPGVFSSQKTICNGPIRIIFELTYSNWNIDGKKLTERKRISLDAGQNLNRIETSFAGLAADDSLSIACGLVKRNNTAIVTDEKKLWMGLWGLTNSDTTNGFLGTGVVLPPSSTAQIAEDKDHYLMIVRTKASDHFIYYSGAGWSRRGDFSTERDWTTYLSIFLQRVQSPLKILLHD